MGYIIGESSIRSTWAANRALTANFGAPGPSPVFGFHNGVYPSGSKFFKTIEGSGYLRGPGQQVRYDANPPPGPDFFFASGFRDPYPEQMVGITVTTSGNSFSITADAFTAAGQDTGTGGTEPVTGVQWFESIP